MSFNVSIQPKTGFLPVLITGEVDVPAAKQSFEDILKASVKSGEKIARTRNFYFKATTDVGEAFEWLDISLPLGI